MYQTLFSEVMEHLMYVHVAMYVLAALLPILAQANVCTKLNL